MRAPRAGTELGSVKQTLTYRFVLSDDEVGRAWLREYYRRPGWRLWRVIGGPCFVGLGIVMATSGELLTRGVGIATIAMGIWYAVKPLVGARAVVSSRRRRGLSDREIEVRLHRDGVRIDDGQVRKELAWSDVRRAGEGSEYFWYEVGHGSRATIPKRVVDDPDALRDKLRAHTEFES